MRLPRGWGVGVCAPGHFHPAPLFKGTGGPRDRYGGRVEALGHAANQRQTRLGTEAAEISYERTEDCQPVTPKRTVTCSISPTRTATSLRPRSTGIRRTQHTTTPKKAGRAFLRHHRTKLRLQGPMAASTSESQAFGRR